jgi:hypothetical protein
VAGLVANDAKYLEQKRKSTRIAGATMADRFSGSLLRNDARDEELPPSLGEIGLNNFAP